MLVARGRLKLAHTGASEPEQVLRILGPGELMGEMALFVPTPIRREGDLVAVEEAAMGLKPEPEGVSNMRRQMMMLRNLDCPACAAKLEKAAAGLPGMKKARVSFATGSLHVEYDPEQVPEGRIQELVRRFGLEVGAVLPE